MGPKPGLGPVRSGNCGRRDLPLCHQAAAPVLRGDVPVAETKGYRAKFAGRRRDFRSRMGARRLVSGTRHLVPRTGPLGNLGVLGRYGRGHVDLSTVACRDDGLASGWAKTKVTEGGDPGSLRAWDLEIDFNQRQASPRERMTVIAGVGCSARG